MMPFSLWVRLGTAGPGGIGAAFQRQPPPWLLLLVLVEHALDILPDAAD